MVTCLRYAHKRLILGSPRRSSVHNAWVGGNTVNVQKANNVRSAVVHNNVHPLAVRGLCHVVRHIQP